MTFGTISSSTWISKIEGFVRSHFTGHCEERYRTLVESISDVVFIIDPSGKIVYLNPSSRLLDAGAQAFLQKPFSISILAQKVKEVLEGR